MSLRSPTLPSLPPGAAPPGNKPPLVPTNTVTTRDGVTVRARIDPSLPVAEVVKALCINLKITEPTLLYALRDEADELVTDENLRKKIKANTPLKLVPAPIIEAAQIIEAISTRSQNLRMALFSLQKYIREEVFANEFLNRDGLRELLSIIASSRGNTLAYALTALQHLMELPYGWSSVQPQFILEVVQILSSPQNLINVCRPATAILKKFVEADPRAMLSTANGAVASSSRSLPVPPPGSVLRFGFDVVYGEMRKENGLLEIVVSRLGSADTMTVLYSLMLINTLLSHATETYWEELTSELDRLNVRKAVIILMAAQSLHEDLTSSLLDFQSNIQRISYRRKNTPVEPEVDPAQESTLQFIWSSSKLNIDGTSTPFELLNTSAPSNYPPFSLEALNNSLNGATNGTNKDYLGLGDFGLGGSSSAEGGANGSASGTGTVTPNKRRTGKGKAVEEIKWRRLGFESEDLRKEFGTVGALGLDCLKSFVLADPDAFASLILEQNRRPPERRCPIAKASNEVVELLSEHWVIYGAGYSTSTAFQPFFLNFNKVHALATQFFIRMWNESGAAIGDFPRVTSLVQSQIKMAMRRESSRLWHEVETAFNDSQYRAVRDRQMKELELEDDLLNKIPVRNLRAKLYKESFEFVRQQRLHCLMQGAWFVNAISVASLQASKEPVRKLSRPWRFMRLDKSMKYIHYIDAAVKFPVRSGLEDLPERIEVAAIAEIAVHTSCLPPNVILPGQPSDPLPGGTPEASPLSFSLLGTREGSLADQIATDGSRWADWTDGLNMLRKDGGHVASQETAAFVHALTEIGLKIKLLDLSGEKVDIPATLTPGPPPPDTNFFFSDL